MTTAPYLRYLRHFSTTPSEPMGIITLSSALRGALRLGLNFPASCTYALGLRRSLSPRTSFGILPFRSLRMSAVSISAQPDVSAIDIDRIPGRTTVEQLLAARRPCGASDIDTDANADAVVETMMSTEKGTTRVGIQQAWRAEDERYLRFFHRVAAGPDDKVGPEEVRGLLEGKWAEQVAERRSSRAEGKGDVLPFSRGGPIGVGPHSWFVRRLFGVRVYEP